MYRCAKMRANASWSIRSCLSSTSTIPSAIAVSSVHRPGPSGTTRRDRQLSRIQGEKKHSPSASPTDRPSSESRARANLASVEWGSCMIVWMVAQCAHVDRVGQTVSFLSLRRPLTPDPSPARGEGRQGGLRWTGGENVNPRLALTPALSQRERQNENYFEARSKRSRFCPSSRIEDHKNPTAQVVGLGAALGGPARAEIEMPAGQRNFARAGRRFHREDGHEVAVGLPLFATQNVVFHLTSRHGLKGDAVALE